MSEQVNHLMRARIESLVEGLASQGEEAARAHFEEFFYSDRLEQTAKDIWGMVVSANKAGRTQDRDRAIGVLEIVCAITVFRELLDQGLIPPDSPKPI